MKKIFAMFAAAMLLVLTGCEVKVAPVLPQAKADYTEALAEVGNPELTAFYEIEMQLNKPVSALNYGEDVQLLNALTVIQAGEKNVKFIGRTYNEKGEVVGTETEYKRGDWFGDCAMNLDSLVLDLPDAIEKLKETNQVLPDGDKVTLRQPLSPPFRPLYIFGTVGTFFVAVDAWTGEVSLLNEEGVLTELKEVEEDAEETAEE